MNRPLLLALMVLAGLPRPVLADPTEFVEPSDLIRRSDLVGREVVVDDRIRYFLESKRGQGFDELLLKRTEVPLRLPDRLKFSRSPTEPNARVRGILRSEDGRLVLEVSSIELLPGDLERLDKEIAKLRIDDFTAKRKWALWAERRGHELNDPKLEARGVALEGEALWSEAERPDSDNLALATRAASRPIASSVRNALAHRGFRDRLSRASTPAELDALARQIEATLPDSVDPKASQGSDSTWTAAYVKDPANAYRGAPEAARRALDRRLLADTIERSLQTQVNAKPGDAAELAQQAATRLPDRPNVADQLRQRGLGEAESRVASLRQSEVEELARSFREQGQEDRARRLLQAWLDDRRTNRLSATDAEGRVLLAGSFEKLTGDKAGAADLLREALKIDPESRTAVEAFLRMGYRKGEGGWFDPNASKPASESVAEARDESAGSLRGLTRAQVRSRLGGKPDHVVRSATQGRCVEQWIYKNVQGSQIINFIFDPGTPDPRASSNYSTPK
ncbi:tetratricopeptide repeat protein [Tundrisphaera lichenicola]|uniref:tetratricopeptide repeat protein n=1 Tax=Tundrisphaera lichenicola TaxID=2029860 RepID=UPI003EBF4A6E